MIGLLAFCVRQPVGTSSAIVVMLNSSSGLGSLLRAPIQQADQVCSSENPGEAHPDDHHGYGADRNHPTGQRDAADASHCRLQLQSHQYEEGAVEQEG